MLDASFPIFTRPMATSSEMIAPSRLFGCLDLSVMVETKAATRWRCRAKAISARNLPQKDERPS